MKNNRVSFYAAPERVQRLVENLEPWVGLIQRFQTTCPFFHLRFFPKHTLSQKIKTRHKLEMNGLIRRRNCQSKEFARRGRKNVIVSFVVFDHLCTFLKTNHDLSNIAFIHLCTHSL